MNTRPHPSRGLLSVCFWTYPSFPTQPKVTLVRIIALRYMKSTSYEHMSVGILPWDRHQRGLTHDLDRCHPEVERSRRSLRTLSRSRCFLWVALSSSPPLNEMRCQSGRCRSERTIHTVGAIKPRKVILVHAPGIIVPLKTRDVFPIWVRPRNPLHRTRVASREEQVIPSRRQTCARNRCLVSRRAQGACPPTSTGAPPQKSPLQSVS